MSPPELQFSPLENGGGICLCRSSLPEKTCAVCTLAGCWGPRKALDPPCPVRLLVHGQDGQGSGVVRVRGEMGCGGDHVSTKLEACSRHPRRQGSSGRSRSCPTSEAVNEPPAAGVTVVCGQELWGHCDLGLRLSSNVVTLAGPSLSIHFSYLKVGIIAVPTLGCGWW